MSVTFVLTSLWNLQLINFHIQQKLQQTCSSIAPFAITFSQLSAEYVFMLEMVKFMYLMNDIGFQEAKHRADADQPAHACSLVRSDLHCLSEAR